MKNLLKIGLLLFALPLSAQTQNFTDSVFTKNIEGPAVNRNNDLYVVNFEKEGTIGQVAPDGNVCLLMQLPNGSVGNGIKFKNNNEFYVADYVNHNVLLVNAKDKSCKVFAHEAGMSQPNDIAISSHGILYASDPNWKTGTGKLWKIDTTGKVTLLYPDMGTTNGIAVSPGNKYLYVNESVQRKIWRFTLDKEGNPKDKKLFYEFHDFGMDGMRCDVKGNLYVCRYDAGEILILKPNAKILKTVKLLGKQCSNIAFGGADGKQMRVTLQDTRRIEMFTAPYPGLEWTNLKGK